MMREANHHSPGPCTLLQDGRISCKKSHATICDILKCDLEYAVCAPVSTQYEPRGIHIVS